MRKRRSSHLSLPHLGCVACGDYQLWMGCRYLTASDNLSIGKQLYVRCRPRRLFRWQSLLHRPTWVQAHHSGGGSRIPQAFANSPQRNYHDGHVLWFWCLNHTHRRKEPQRTIRDLYLQSRRAAKRRCHFRACLSCMENEIGRAHV